MNRANCHNFQPTVELVHLEVELGAAEENVELQGDLHEVEELLLAILWAEAEVIPRDRIRIGSRIQGFHRVDQDRMISPILRLILLPASALLMASKVLKRKRTNIKKRGRESQNYCLGTGLVVHPV